MSSPAEKILHVARAAIWETPKKQRILIGQRFPSKDEVGPEEKYTQNYAGRWETPGGKVDEDELGIETAVREISEETGLSVVRTPLVTFVHSYLMVEPGSEDSKFYGYRVNTLAIEAVARNPQALFALPPEHQFLVWVTLAEAEARNLIPQSSFMLPHLRERQRTAQQQPAYFFFETRYKAPLLAVGEVR